MWPANKQACSDKQACSEWNLVDKTNRQVFQTLPSASVSARFDEVPENFEMSFEIKN